MKIKNIRLAGLGFIAAAALSACSDVVNYEDELVDKFAADGAPVIEAIYDVQDTGFAEPLTGGVLNQMLRIKGKNLSFVKKITFNGVEVDVRQVYAESANSYVKIPRVIPESVTNQLVYETQNGTVTREFEVNIPTLELDGLKNEFTLPGKQVGDYFDLYGFNDSTSTTATITITNAEQAYHETIKCDSCTEEFSSIIIPKDCPENSLITFAWDEMGTQKTKTIPYRMTKDLMFGDFTGDLGWWNDWGRGLVYTSQSSDDPEDLGYAYLRVTGTYGSWAWNSTGFGCNWRWLDASAHPENYWVKFEVWTASGSPFYSYGNNDIYNNKNGGYCITLNNGDPRRQFDPVAEYGLRNTYGQWITVRMPLDEMISGKPLPTEESWVNTEFVLQPNNDDGWTVDHAFGQFRIEPKNY